MTFVGGTSSSGPVLQASGLISGLNTQQIIQALLQPYLQPEQDLQIQQSQLQTQAKDWQQINTDLASLQSTAQSLTTSSGAGWPMQATSSDTSVATATAAPGTPAGSVSFTVGQLAAANVLDSAGTVSATSDTIATANTGFLLAQASSLGFSELSAGSSLALGSHSVDVTQASQAATTTGATALASSTTIGSSNDTIDVTINGTAYAYTIASGTYTQSQLAAAVTSASGGTLQASVNASGYLVLSTTDQGSAATLQVTGGTALSSLGLSTMSSAVSGVNALVNVDGTVNTIGNSTTGPITAGATFNLTSGTGGTMSATVGPGGSIDAGTTTATNVSTGNGSLADLVANINAANAGVSASAIDTSNGYLLQLSANSTGTNADLTVNTGAFSSSTLGALQSVQAGQNAEVYLNGLTTDKVTSQSNTVTSLLPGLSINLLATSSTETTVTVGADAANAAKQVSSLVTAANAVLADIAKYASYNQQTKVAGPLFGSPLVSSIQSQILSIFGMTTGSSTLGNPQAIGITLQSNGTIAFNQSAFETALQANPAQVEAMFTQGGSFSPSSSTYTGDVTFENATGQVAAGNYAVSVTHSATQATDSGSVLTSGTVSAAETMTIAAGGTSIGYTTTAGESLASIAEGLNQLFAQAGMGMSAMVVNGDQLQVVSSAYGSAASFTVSSTNTATGTTGLAGSGSATFTGTDIAGTINGQAATGTGQILSANGLSLQVTASGITSATNIGTFAYQPGIAQQVSNFAQSMSSSPGGVLTQTIQNLNNQATGLNPQINYYAMLASQQKAVLEQTFSQLEVQLGTLKSEGNALSQFVNGLP